MTTMNDGLESLKTGLGRKSAQRQYKNYSRKTNSFWLNIYRNSWLGEKYVDKTAKDMTKKWRSIKTSQTNAEKLKELEKLEEQFKVPVIVEEALTWGALFGEVLVLAITDIDSENYKNPLDPNEKLLRFLVIDEYKNGEINNDIFSSSFGEPSFYTIKNIEIHETRVSRLIVGKVPFSERSKNGGKGVSDLQSKMEIIKAFDTISTSVADLIEDSKVDVLKMHELNNQIAAGQEGNIIKYAQLAQEIKSQNNMLLIDKDDDYDQKEHTFGGLSDLWVKSREVVAGALDRPITVVFGQSASGFASGEEDNKAYYETINSLQESRLRPLLDFIDSFLLKLAGIDSDDFGYEFPSIDSMNKLDEATILNTYATAVANLYQQGLLTGEQILKELKQRDIFSNISESDIVKIKELDEIYDNQSTNAYQGQAASTGATPITSY